MNETPTSNNGAAEAASADPQTDAGDSDSERTKLFLQLFLQNQRRLYGYIVTLLPNRADADDVLQEVSQVLWDKFDARRPPENFAAWGCRIAYFKILDWFKKNHRSRVRFSHEMLEQIAETAVEQAEVLQLDERREALAECLRKLSTKDRDLLDRRFAVGATTESTAVESGRSIDAVYKSISRIRRRLFDCVTRSLAQQRSS